jgi:hypothetical protein
MPEPGPINKETAAKLAFLCWGENSTETIKDAWDIIGFHDDVSASGSLPDDEACEDDFRREGLCDIKYRHHDVEMMDIRMLDHSPNTIEDHEIIE